MKFLDLQWLWHIPQDTSTSPGADVANEIVLSEIIFNIYHSASFKRSQSFKVLSLCFDTLISTTAIVSLENQYALVFQQKRVEILPYVGRREYFEGIGRLTGSVVSADGLHR